MFRFIYRVIPLLTLWCLIVIVPAQQSSGSNPDKTWSGNFGAGYSLTGGNTDTSNFNLSFDALRDPQTLNVIMIKGLYLRSDQDDEKTADRLRLTFRDEYTFSERTFLYFDMGYLRDPFKEIDYLLNPQGGIGYKLYDTEKLSLGLSGGAGAVWENNSGQETTTSGSINAGQTFNFQLAEGSALAQAVSALWKADDFEDALYQFSIGLTTALTSRMELKVEFIDDYKNKPPRPDVKKNDTAFITSFLFTF